MQDRLRWCRYHMGLMQKEIGYVDHYPKEIVDKLAEFYQIPVDEKQVFKL